ncbi:MAG TPA: hypothetical protein VFP65_14430 [Anaeromyxobacteraceae bacterium]|nr:hypothetical protein [Anaeromyxobacteraceae bacterium]
MDPRERLRHARLAYMRALTRSQSGTSRTAWQRLVTARKNLRAALHDVERSFPEAAAPGHPPV